MVDHVRDQLVSLLDLQDCRFEYGKLMGSPARLESDGTIVTRHGRWDADQFGLPAGEIETFAGGQYFGRFMLTPKPRLAAIVAGTHGRSHAG